MAIEEAQGIARVSASEDLAESEAPDSPSAPVLPSLRLANDNASDADDNGIEPGPHRRELATSTAVITRANVLGIGGYWTSPELVDACGATLRWLRRNGHAGSIAVTSTLRGEGRTTIASGMAVAESYTHGRPVILVELDLERRSFAQRFGLSQTPGVAEILREEASIGECLQTPGGSSIAVITAGDTQGHQGELLVQLRACRLLADLELAGAQVIADLPPLAPVGQAASLANVMGSVLLVVRSGGVPAARIRRAIDALDTPPSVFLNCVHSSIPRPLRAVLGG
jgi:Mrp family chromosome partitioning ATPase